MKLSSIITLSVLTTIGFSSPLLAQENVATNNQQAHNIVEISPSDLVSAAYQGRFTNQGIPSGSRFIGAIKTNKLQPRDLIKTAISAGRLSEATLNDRSYLNSVRTLADNLDTN